MKREKIGFFGATVQKRSDSEFVFEKERERDDNRVGASKDE